jgi:hypothetical protein
MQENLKLLMVIGLLSLLSAGCAKIRRMDSTQLNVLPISQMIENPTNWEVVGKEINGGKTVVFKVASGQRVPLKLIMDIPVGTVEKSENIVVFNRDLYLSISQTQLEVSPDGQRWASLGSVSSLKKLFGVREGQMSVGFQAREGEGTFISLDVSAK